MPEAYARSGHVAQARSAVEHHAVEHLVHRARRLGTARLADHLGGTARNRHVVWNRIDHHRTRGNARAVPDLDVAEDFCTRADHHAVADFRMTVLMLLAGAAEGNVMQDRHVVVDHRRLADDEPRGMVEEDAAADARGRIDVALENDRRAALQIHRKVLATLAQKPMRQPVRLNGVKTFVIKYRLAETLRCWVTVDGRNYIGAKAFAELRLILERVVIGLPDQIGGDVGMIEPLRDAMHGRVFETIVMQDVLIHEGGEFGLAPRHLFRLSADARPYGIDFIDRRGLPRLLVSHVHLQLAWR